MRENDPIATEASEWLARKDRGLTDAEQIALDAWLAQDDRHCEEFGRLAGTWSYLDSADRSPELARMAAEVVARHRGAGRRPVLTAWWLAFGTAAAASLTFGIWMKSQRAAPVGPALAATYRVVPSHAHTLRLSDGSVVDVKTGGEVTADFSSALRRTLLTRGEAHFAVARNPARPFIVDVGCVAVRAVGTAFDVLRTSAEIDVLVTEGKVTVEKVGGVAETPTVPMLLAGQRARISLNGDGSPSAVSVVSVVESDVDRDLAWKSAWLVFDRTPLADAVEAFNRQSGAKLAVGDPSLRERLIGGTFRADNVDGFVRLLEDSADIRSLRSPGGEIALLPAR